jgi:hypothetical protein
MRDGIYPQLTGYQSLVEYYSGFLRASRFSGTLVVFGREMPRGDG